MEETIVTENTARKSPDFCDQVQRGFDLVCRPEWMEGILSVQKEEEES